MTYDAVAIGESQHLRHLVFIDDWYRNVRTDDAGDFFIWLNSANASNVRVVIGDRKAAGRFYMQYLYAGNDGTQELNPAENKAILERVLNVVASTAPASQWLRQHIHLVKKNTTFHGFVRTEP